MGGNFPPFPLGSLVRLFKLLTKECEHGIIKYQKKKEK